MLEKLGPMKEKIYHGHKLSHDEGPNLHYNKLSTLAWSLRVMLFIKQINNPVVLKSTDVPCRNIDVPWCAL